MAAYPTLDLPPQPPPILDLPGEVAELVGRLLLASPRDALRFGRACRDLHSKLEAVRALAEARRLRWLPSVAATHEVSDEGRTLTVLRRSDDAELWIVGGPLPTVGVSAWKVRVNQSRSDDGNGLWIGVCDAAARCSWGLFLFSGRLRRISRDAHGKLDFTGRSLLPGYPNGNYKQVMKDEAGRRASLRGGANGAVVEVLVDHDAGSLSYRVNGGPGLEALPLRDGDRGHGREAACAFPKGAALRPYASCYYPGDRLSFVAAFV